MDTNELYNLFNDQTKLNKYISKDLVSDDPDQLINPKQQILILIAGHLHLNYFNGVKVILYLQAFYKELKEEHGLMIQ